MLCDVQSHRQSTLILVILFLYNRNQISLGYYELDNFTCAKFHRQKFLNIVSVLDSCHWKKIFGTLVHLKKGKLYFGTKLQGFRL